MGEEEILNEFSELDKSASRNKTARLRDLYDAIELLKSRGFAHVTIIKAMKKHGLEFNLQSFEATLYRIKRERMKRLVQRPEATLEERSDGSINNKAVSLKKAAEPLQATAPKTGKQATQQELKAIARSHIDPNQFIDE